MKIIDLLNMISKGEEVPYRIKYIGKIYEYVEEMKWYLRDDMKCELSNSKKCLNDEVEIIEEDKKIEKLEMFIPQRESDTYCTKYNEIVDKINEIIDKLNKGDKE